MTWRFCLLYNNNLMKKGVVFATAAYLTWGFYPIYFKALQSVPAFQIMTHRVVWCFLFITILIIFKRQLHLLKLAVKPRILLVYLAAGVFLSINWFTFIWGVNAGFVVENSLGYFINPLFSVLLGVVFLGERLRPIQWVSVCLAALGVTYLAVNYGSPPWIALTLAGTFGLYGLIKKVGPLDSVPGLVFETGMMFLPALGYLVIEEVHGVSAFGHASGAITLLLIFCGFVTAAPLLLFAGAMRTVPLSTMGLLQYMNPTIQILIGVYLYGEPFPPVRMIGFGIIWTALLIYTLESYLNRRKVALLPI
jgi:chloramphenicol-sensitive protein RarD